MFRSNAAHGEIKKPPGIPVAFAQNISGVLIGDTKLDGGFVSINVYFHKI